MRDEMRDERGEERRGERKGVERRGEERRGEMSVLWQYHSLYKRKVWK